MIRFGRLAGAILLDYNSDFFLIGHTKEPCDFAQHGFEAIDSDRDQEAKIEKLSRKEGTELSWDEDSIIFTVADASCEEVLTKLSDIFLIRRNNMVSERIWGLFAEELPTDTKQHSGQWMMESPAVIWDIVRDSVLRC